MSDLPPEYIEQLKARDSRFAQVEASIAIETDIRDSAVIKALLSAVKADSDQAIVDLASVSPTDLQAISFQLVKIRTFVYINTILNSILTAGRTAEMAIRAEDQAEWANERD